MDKRAGNSAKVAILDAGSQFGGLIDRNVRELGFRTSLLPLETPIEKLEKFEAIIISGGPKSVEDKDAHLCDPNLFNLGRPILGICYGMQLMAKLQDGKVGKNPLREDGPQTAEFKASKLFEGLAGGQKVLMSHGDSVVELPKDFTVTATSGPLVAAMENSRTKQYGVQFHPEVFQTERGTDIFQNFLFNIACLKPDYTAEDQEQEALEYIQDSVGSNDVVVFVSGGVDSAVLAVLIAKIVPKEKIHAFHVDTGVMRANESREAIAALKDAGLEVKLLNMVKTFAKATTNIDGKKTAPLDQVTDPQIKRKIIGDTFIKVREKILADNTLSEDTVLAQGSLRPDLIESGSHLASTKADTIKTHHNDTAEVRKLREEGKVVEPLQQLYKDQVRVMGRRLGLPPNIIDRHPFPGPGLAVRVLCAEKPYRLDNHVELQTQLDNFVEGSGFRVHLLPVRTVGVQGDGRSYKYLAGVEGPADWHNLRELAASIPNNNHAVNRVVYIFGDKVNRHKLGVTLTKLTKETTDQLRNADSIVTDVLREYDLMGSVSQMPVILTPVNFGEKGSRSIALRPFKTPDFMTGIPVLPPDIPEVALTEMVEKILQDVPGISKVMLDLSSKPPGTTEWE
jgi:GMP synthase (glutamine-hydrolysing)